MKSRVHPKYKTKYHVGNWPEYERALVRRGDITLWLSADAIAAMDTCAGRSTRRTAQDLGSRDRDRVGAATRLVLAPFAVDQAADLCSCGHENVDSATALVTGMCTTAPGNA